MMPVVDATARFRPRMSDAEMRAVWRDLAAAGCDVRCERREGCADCWAIAVQHPAWDGPLDPEALPFYYYYRRDRAGIWRAAA